MNRLPSTSSRYAPRARRMNSGDAPTDLNARTGLSTPPGRIFVARAKSRADRVVFMAISKGLRDLRVFVMKLLERAGGLSRVIRDDDVGAGAADGRERF